MSLSTTTKKILVMSFMLGVMATKILVAVRMLHKWKMQAIAEGRPFGDAEDRRNR